MMVVMAIAVMTNGRATHRATEPVACVCLDRRTRSTELSSTLRHVQHAYSRLNPYIDRLCSLADRDPAVDVSVSCEGFCRPLCN